MGLGQTFRAAAYAIDGAAGRMILAVGMPIKGVLKSVSWNGGAYRSNKPWSENPRRRTDEQWLRDYGTTSVLRKPVARIADDTSVVPWHLWKILPGQDPAKIGPRRQEIYSHPILDLWRRPNPMMTGRVFRKLITTYLLLVGRAPVRIERREDGVTPRWLWPLVPTDVKKMPDPARPFWIVQTRGHRETVPVQDIIWITEPDPLDPYGWGLGAAMAVDDEVQQATWMNRYNNAFFREGAHLGKIVNIPGLDDDNADRLTSAFKTNHVGILNAFRTLFTGSQGPGNMTVTDVSPNHKDMDFNVSMERVDEATRQNFGPPPEVVGKVQNSNRATIDSSDYLEQKKCVLPQLIGMAEWVNEFVVPLFPDAETLLMQHENPVQESTEQRHIMLNDGLRAGSVLIDEWREGHEMDPLPNGEGQRLLVPVNITMVLPDGKVQGAGAPDAAEKPQQQIGKVIELFAGGRR